MLARRIWAVVEIKTDRQKDQEADQRDEAEKRDPQERAIGFQPFANDETDNGNRDRDC